MDNFTLHVNNMLKHTLVRESAGEKVVLKQEENAEDLTGATDAAGIAAAGAIANTPGTPGAPAAKAATNKLSGQYKTLVDKLATRLNKLNSKIA